MFPPSILLCACHLQVVSDPTAPSSVLAVLLKALYARACLTRQPGIIDACRRSVCLPHRVVQLFTQSHSQCQCGVIVHVSMQTRTPSAATVIHTKKVSSLSLAASLLAHSRTHHQCVCDQRTHKLSMCQEAGCRLSSVHAGGCDKQQWTINNCRLVGARPDRAMHSQW